MGLLNNTAPHRHLQGTSALKVGFLVSLHPKWGLMPKEPLSFANTSPIDILAVRDLASELVPIGSFLPTVLFKKLYVLTTVTASALHPRRQCCACTLSLP